MKIISIEPTPNPNSMKLTLDERLPSGEKHAFSRGDESDKPKELARILGIEGVESIFRVADFLAVQRDPGANWASILAEVRRLCEEDQCSPADAGTERKTEPYGEIQVSCQYFRQIPMLVKVSDGQAEKRMAIPERFLEAVQKAAKASSNMLMERKWESLGIRYGELEDVGAVVVEEIDAAYGGRRLSVLVDLALRNEDSKVKARPDEDELDRMAASTEWRERFAALTYFGADPKRLEILVDMARDPVMNVRRLAVVLIGLVGGDEACSPLCEALNDAAVGVRRAAGDALTDLGDRRALQPMTASLSDANKLVRWRAARFLYEHGDHSVLEALHACENDPEFEVSMQVRQAIERIESGQAAQGTVWQQMTDRRETEA